MSKKQNSLFGGADFVWVIEKDEYLIINDLDEGNRSVTNDIENVLAKIKSETGADLSKLKIVYLDSQRLYDAVMVKADGTFDRFAPLGVNDLSAALSLYDEKYAA